MVRQLPLILLFLMSSMAVRGQGFWQPTEGNAAIYFVRTSSLAFAVNFSFFHERKYIGDFGGRNYLRYECAPGTHLFWASAENCDFIHAEVKAGGTYVVVVDVDLGDSVAHVRFKPITVTSREFERVKKLVDRKKPVHFTAGKLKEEQSRKQRLIDRTMGLSERQTKNLSVDMAIPSKFF